MWRALFAVAHADSIITDEEIRFMAEAMEDIPFTAEQKSILTEDIKNPQDIIAMFQGISDARDQAKFFQFARNLVWADGDFGKAEQDIMLKLLRAHVKQVDMEELIGNVDLEFDDGTHRPAVKRATQRRAKEIITSFRKIFLKDQFNGKR